MGRVVPSRTTLGCVQIPSDVTLEDEGPPFAEQMGIDIQMTKAGSLAHTHTQSCRVACRYRSSFCIRCGPLFPLLDPGYASVLFDTCEVLVEVSEVCKATLHLFLFRHLATKVSFDSEDICAGTYLRAMQREELTKGAKTLAALAASLMQRALGLKQTSCYSCIHFITPSSPTKMQQESCWPRGRNQKSEVLDSPVLESL